MKKKSTKKLVICSLALIFAGASCSYGQSLDSENSSLQNYGPQYQSSQAPYASSQNYNTQYHGQPYVAQNYNRMNSSQPGSMYDDNMSADSQQMQRSSSQGTMGNSMQDMQSQDIPEIALLKDTIMYNHALIMMMVMHQNRKHEQLLTRFAHTQEERADLDRLHSMFKKKAAEYIPENADPRSFNPLQANRSSTTNDLRMLLKKLQDEKLALETIDNQYNAAFDRFVVPVPVASHYTMERQMDDPQDYAPQQYRQLQPAATTTSNPKSTMRETARRIVSQE